MEEPPQDEATMPDTTKEEERAFPPSKEHSDVSPDPTASPPSGSNANHNNANGDASVAVSVFQDEPADDDDPSSSKGGDPPKRCSTGVTDRSSLPPRRSSSVNTNDPLRYSEHAFPHPDDCDGDGRGKKSIFVKHAESIAAKPCLHLSVAMCFAIGLSVIGLFLGEFEVAVDNAGWRSRGTVIGDRETQMLLVRINEEKLFLDKDGSHWDELKNNIQKGWESQTDDRINADDDRRRNRRLSRVMEEGFEQNKGCRVDWYGSDAMLDTNNLVAVWKTDPDEDDTSVSALDADVLYDICEAETNTLSILEKDGLCYGCDKGKCIPPYSLVLMARQFLGDDKTSCKDLKTIWPSVQSNFTTTLAQCVDDYKAVYNPDSNKNPKVDSCPKGFAPTVVDKEFSKSNTMVRYTSSYFATGKENAKALYEKYEELDTASGERVLGAYDTTKEDFLEMYVDGVIGKDMVLAMGSAGITILAMIVHTRSLWLAFMGLLQIVLSFPLAYFVYYFIGRLEFFPFLNFIGIFVVFALGADDVFVAVDKWKNARLELKDGSTSEVAALALPDAAGAMLLTSSTTAVAFFGTAICPVAPIRCFAVFCGLLIVLDYLMNIFLVFPSLCLYDKWLMGGRRRWYITFEKKNVDHDAQGEAEEPRACDLEAEESLALANIEEEKPSLITRILDFYYTYLHKLRFALLVAVTGAIIGCSIVASRLTLPVTAEVSLLSDSHEYQVHWQWKPNLLSSELEKAGGSEVFLYWGLTPADTGNHNNPDSWTTLELDEEFKPHSESSQIYLRDFCDRLYSTNFAKKPSTEYVCPINLFDKWLQDQSKMDTPEEAYVSNCNNLSSLPVPEDLFDNCIIAWSQSVRETSILQERGAVKIMFITASSIARYDSAYSILDEEWSKFEEWLDIERGTAPSTVSNFYHTSEDFWWYDTNGSMLQTAYSAAGIALACAAIVVFVSSRSFILMLFCAISIAYVLVAATACLVGLGWKLGFLESICFAILIGISCDFVIHLSHAYTLYPGKRTRHQRTRFSLVHMGPSILAAATTTFFAAVIMVFTEIVFFQKFAVILFMTIIHSTVGSFLVFLVLADCFGPSQPTYLADKIGMKCHDSWKKLRSSCCGNRKLNRSTEDALEMQTP